MSHAEQVDDAVAKYISQYRAANGKTPTFVEAWALAQVAGVVRWVMSSWLQEHRSIQDRAGGRGYKVRYKLSSSGAGRGAIWRILNVPSGDPMAQRQNRKLQAQYIAEDAVRKINKDVRLEINPALKGTSTDTVIDIVMTNMKTNIESAVSTVLSILATTSP